MRRQFLALTSVLICITSTADAVPSATSLCGSTEDVLFACQSGQRSSISVCASSDASASAGHLVYRFGEVGQKPEFIYPADATIPKDAFKFAQACNAKGCTEQLSFTVQEIIYTVYSDHYAGPVDPTEDAGVYVERDGREVADFHCTSPRAPQDLDRIGARRDGIVDKVHRLGLPVAAPRATIP